MAEYTEIIIDQGTDFSYNIAVIDEKTNDNVDITGYTFTSQMKKSYYSKNVSANLVCSIHSPFQGIFSISIDAANSALIKPGRYLFDVKYDTGTSVKRALEGYITVTPEITK